jgi:hypothetical protein
LEFKEDGMIDLNDTDIRTIIEAAKEDNAGRTNTKQQAGDAGRNISPINPAIGLSLPLLAAL